MRESKRAESWLEDPRKMRELAQRVFRMKHPDGVWDDLFTNEQLEWEEFAQEIVGRTVLICEAKERMAESVTAEDILDAA